MLQTNEITTSGQILCQTKFKIFSLNSYLIISIISVIVGIIISFLQYKKDQQQNNPKALAKLRKRLFIFTIIAVFLNAIVPIFNLLKSTEEQPATKGDLAQFERRLFEAINSKPNNPPKEEVESELEKEIRIQFEKNREKALHEYLLGSIAYVDNLMEIAITHFKNALRIVEIPSFYLALGNSYYVISQYGPAMENYEISLKLYKDKENLIGEAAALAGIGLIYINKGDLDNALKYLQDALVINREIGDRQGEANQLGNIGGLFCIKGDLDNAIKYMQAALIIDREIGDRSGESNQLGNIGLIYRDKGDLDNSLKYQQDALVIDREIEYRLGEGNQLGNIGLIYSDKGDLDNSLKYLREAEKIFKEIGAIPQLQTVQRDILYLINKEEGPGNGITP